MNEWWYAVDGQRQGPVTETELGEMLQEGAISGSTLVWREGFEAWVLLESDPVFAALQKKMPPPVPEQSVPPLPGPPPLPPRLLSPESVVRQSANTSQARAPAPPQAASAAKVDSGVAPLRPATAWRRFFARLFDIWVGTLIVSGIVLAASQVWPSLDPASWNPGIVSLSPLIILVIALLLEALPCAVFGNTPGKALLGIRVTDKGGQRIGFWRYLDRNVSVWISGLCFGIPILSFYTLWRQGRRVAKLEQATYDVDKFAVMQRPVGALRVAIFISLLVLMLLINVVLNQVADHLQRGGAMSEQLSVKTASPTAVASSPALTQTAGAVSDGSGAALNCAQYYYAGREPLVIDPERRANTLPLCMNGTDLRYSTERHTALWAAEHLNDATMAASSQLKEMVKPHVEGRLPASSRPTLDDVPDNFEISQLVAPWRVGTVEARHDAASLANMIPMASEETVILWLNAGIELTDRVDEDNSVFVISGTIYEGGAPERHTARIVPPSAVYAAFYDTGKDIAGAYVVENKVRGAVKVLTLAELEARIGINLFPAVSRSVKAARQHLPLPKNHF